MSASYDFKARHVAQRTETRLLVSAALLSQRDESVLRLCTAGDRICLRIPGPSVIAVVIAPTARGTRLSNFLQTIDLDTGAVTTTRFRA